VSPKTPAVLVAVFLLAGARMASAQDSGLSPSPTLPSDTLEANYAPRSEPGPMPELAPTLPSDTLDATAPVDSFPTDPFDEAAPDDSVPGDSAQDDAIPREASPATPDDSAALRDLRSWIQLHPGIELPVPPPPPRAVLARV
jgi:hypothetical protein